MDSVTAVSNPEVQHEQKSDVVLCQRVSDNSAISLRHLTFTGTELPADVEYRSTHKSLQITPVVSFHVQKHCNLQSVNGSQMSYATIRETQFGIHKWHITTGHCTT